MKRHSLKFNRDTLRQDIMDYAFIILFILVWMLVILNLSGLAQRYQEQSIGMLNSTSWIDDREYSTVYSLTVLLSLILFIYAPIWAYFSRDFNRWRLVLLILAMAPFAIVTYPWLGYLGPGPMPT